MNKRLTKPPKESSIHKQVANYLKLQYPNIIFRTDFSAGARMSIGQASIHSGLQSDKSYPDLFIAKPCNGYHGLYLELKRDVSEIFKKDMTLKRKMIPIYKRLKGVLLRVGEYDHIGEQAKMIQRLNELGYHALFACGFEHAKKAIDEYLKPKL
jgi:hypothetical protein